MQQSKTVNENLIAITDVTSRFDNRFEIEFFEI